jgi:hypothetical protein
MLEALQKQMKGGSEDERRRRTAAEAERQRLEREATAKREAEERVRRAAAAEVERQRVVRDAVVKREAEEKVRQDERQRQMEVETRRRSGGDQRRPEDDADRLEDLLQASVAAAQTQQPSKRALEAACLVGLVLVSSVGVSVWIADTLRTPVPPRTSVAVSPFEDAAAAYDRGDYATALRLYRPLADQGDAPAQNDLGLMYRDGRGVPQDYAEALTWYRLAADQGNAGAQNSLGVLYQNGHQRRAGGRRTTLRP